MSLNGNGKMPDYWKIQKNLESAWEAVAHSVVYDRPVTEKALQRAQELIESSKEDKEFRYDLYAEAYDNLKQAWEFIKLGNALPLQVIIAMVNQAAHDILSLRISITGPFMIPLKACMICKRIFYFNNIETCDECGRETTLIYTQQG